MDILIQGDLEFNNGIVRDRKTGVTLDLSKIVGHNDPSTEK